MSDMTPIQIRSAAYDLAARRWGDLKSARAQHEMLWTQLARMFRPQLGGFGFDDPATRAVEKPVSSAGIFAAEAFASGLYGALTNPANRWFGFQSNDEDVNAFLPAKQWMDNVTDRVLASFGPAISPYYSTAMQTFTAMAVLGNAAEYDEVDEANGKIIDVSVGLGEIVVDIDFYGEVCEVVRRFYLTPSQAVRHFGSKACPPKMLELAAKNSTDRIVFYHHVMRNDEWLPGRKLGAKGKPWLSRYATEIERCLLREAGYDEMPFYFARWAVDSGQTYGLGAGYVALPSGQTHQLMDDAVIRAAQKGADPVLLAPDRETMPLNGQFRPGRLIYGAMDTRGNQLVRALESGNINLTLQDRQQKLEEVKDAFHFSLMNLAGRTGMTATEVMAITEERQRLWAPHQGRIQQEYLARKIARRFSILWRAGQLPPPPQGIPEGTALEVKYLSAAAAAQQSVEANGLLRILEDTRALAAVSPEAGQRMADRLDPDGALETLITARGAPARAFRTREDADQISKARADQQAQMQQMQMAQAGAGALKDAASAAGSMPPEMLAAMGGGA